MRRENSIYERSRTGSLVSAAIIVAALYFGRDILLPFALAFLLSFLLAPLVEVLETWRLRRIPAVLTVVTIAFLGFGALAFLLAHEVYDLAYRLPDYKENILAKAETFQSDGTGLLDRVKKSVDEMRAKFSAASGEKTPGQPVVSTRAPEKPTRKHPPQVAAVPSLSGESPTTPQAPVPVEVVESLSAKEIAQGVLGPLISPLASGAMVIVFTIFMLLKREDLRNRLIHLIGGEKLNVTTQAIDDAASRVSRYLLMQLLINSVYGFVVFLGLALIGLPNALLWGTLTAVLRFVPYVGPWIAASMPLAVSLAVFDGWSRPALVLALFLVNELVSNNVLEPWLYGVSTGISTIGILASAVFWGWIWGPVGLVMATPLTVCLIVVGRYVPQLAFLNTALGDEDVMPPHSRFYQRLLALDPDEAMEVAEDYLSDTSLEQLYDKVVLPALSLAEQDRHHGALDDEKQQFVNQTTREIVLELGERAAKVASEIDNSADVSATAVPAIHTSPILCLPARDEADEIAGLMLAQLLAQRGVTVQVASSKTLSGEMVELINIESIAVVCISALPPLAATHARYLCKRLRPTFPNIQLIVGIWQTSEMGKKARDRLNSTGIDKLVTTLSDAAKELERLSRRPKVAESK